MRTRNAAFSPACRLSIIFNTSNRHRRRAETDGAVADLRSARRSGHKIASAKLTLWSAISIARQFEAGKLVEERRHCRDSSARLVSVPVMVQTDCRWSPHQPRFATNAKVKSTMREPRSTGPFLPKATSGSGSILRELLRRLDSALDARRMPAANMALATASSIPPEEELALRVALGTSLD